MGRKNLYMDGYQQNTFVYGVNGALIKIAWFVWIVIFLLDPFVDGVNGALIDFCYLFQY